MSNPSYGSDPVSEGTDPRGPAYDPPQYGSTTGYEDAAGGPYASNAPYETTDPNAPASGSYAGGGYVTGTDLGNDTGSTNYGGSPSTKDVAKDEAANVKDTAVGAGKQVASTAKEEVANVAGEAKEQAKGLLSSATSELKSQASSQQSRLAGTLRGYTDQLQGLSQGQGLEEGPLNDLVQRVAGRGSEIVTWLENREPADVLEEVRRFARRRPVVFLALCSAAGVLAGRIARGAVAANTSVDSAKPARAIDTGYESTTTTYATGEPGYGQTGSTYGAYTDAPAAGYSTDTAYTTDPTSVGYSDRGDPIR